MDSNDILIIAIIAGIIWCVIIYNIIFYAVKSAMKSPETDAARHTRLLMLLMKEKGIDTKKIKRAYLETDDTKFWNEFIENKTSEKT